MHPGTTTASRYTNLDEIVGAIRRRGSITSISINAALTTIQTHGEIGSSPATVRAGRVDGEDY
jgi:hypothetical protein